MRKERQSELGRVLEIGWYIDDKLKDWCAYYPRFVYVEFTDEETNELVKGQQLLCKKCCTTAPNLRCSHGQSLISIPFKPKVKTILRKGRAMLFRWLDSRTKEWSCCGHTWQLMMSRYFPERNDWKPVCPTCGGTV